MAANPSTKLPEAPVAKPAEGKAADDKVQRLRPGMPQIPGGVADGGSASSTRPAPKGSSGLDNQRLMQIGLIAAVALVTVVMILWNFRGKPSVAPVPAAAPETSEQPVPPPQSLPTLETPAAPNVAATVDELSKPWSARKFTFVKPFTQENVNAMVIKLPNGGLWAFSLQAPFGRCELEFVTDLAAIASQYKFNATHPMVVNPCDGTVYDPLKIGPLGVDTWARGEIVRGSGLRPPIAIDVKVKGNSIIADGIE